MAGLIDSNRIFNLEMVSKTYNGRMALNSASFSVRERECVAVVGPSRRTHSIVYVVMAMGLTDTLEGCLLPAMLAVNIGLVGWWNKVSWLNGLIIAAIFIGARIALALA